MGVIHVAFCTDEGYGPYTGVAMTSIVLNNIGKEIHFHILAQKINRIDFERMKNMENLYRNCTVSFYGVDNQRMSSYKTGFHFTTTAYFRWLIPYLLDSSIDRVLYLDGDVLCTGDIEWIYSSSLDDFPFMAVSSKDDESAGRLCLQNNKLMNSGELLIDMNMWRKQNVTERCFKVMEEKGDTFMWVDNDALNCVADGAFAAMPDKFCRLIDCAVEQNDCTRGGHSTLHFLGGMKPWKKACLNINKTIWWSYARRSLWYDIEPQEPRTLAEVVYLARALSDRGNHEEARKYYEIALKVLSKEQKS